jgi:hypothetical protein
MIRFYYKDNKKQALKNTSEYTRIEGGQWFTEIFETFSKSYRVQRRFSVENIFFEHVYPMEDSFMQTPCWQDGPLLRVGIVRSEMDWTLFELAQQPESELAQMVLSGPLQTPLPEWVIQELEFHNISKETLLSAIRTCEPRAFLNPIAREPLEQQHPKQRAGSPLQKQPQTQSSNERVRVDPRAASSSSGLKPASKQHLQPELQVPVFSVPKSVQIGSLCPPVNLPAELPPRKTLDRQKAPRLPHARAHVKAVPQFAFVLSELTSV